MLTKNELWRKVEWGSITMGDDYYLSPVLPIYEGERPSSEPFVIQSKMHRHAIEHLVRTAYIRGILDADLFDREDIYKDVPKKASLDHPIALSAHAEDEGRKKGYCK